MLRVRPQCDAVLNKRLASGSGLKNRRGIPTLARPLWCVSLGTNRALFYSVGPLYQTAADTSIPL